MDRQAKSFGSSWTFMLVVILMVFGLSYIGYRYYYHHRLISRGHAEREILAVAALKVDQIVKWRRGQLQKAAVLNQNIFFLRGVEEFFRLPHNLEQQRELLQWMNSLIQMNDYCEVLLFDSHGILRLATGKEKAKSTQAHSMAIEAMSRRKAILSGLHRTEDSVGINLNLMAPLFRLQGDDTLSIGCLLLKVDPAKFLNPLIQTWPSPSWSSETLLIRKEGEEIVFLNELRHQKNTTLTLRFPLTNRQLPAVVAALGREGIFEGVDYRGVPVIAALTHVPDSDWFLVSKIDVGEIYTPIRQYGILLALLTCALIVGATACVGLLWRQQRLRLLRQREEMLRESEKRYHDLADFLPQTVFEMDENGRLEFVNRYGIEMFGYESEDLQKGLNAFELIASEERDQAKEKLAQAIVGERLGGMEFTAVRKSGSTFPAIVHASPVLRNGSLKGIRGIAVDITDLKRAAREVLEWKRRYDLTVAASGQVVYDYNVASGMIFWSSGIEKVLGYTSSEIDGGIEQWSRLIHPEDRQRALDQSKIAQSEITPYDVEYRLHHKRGHYVWVHDRAFFINDASNATMSMLGVVQDITERKQAEQALRESEENYRRLVEASPFGIAVHMEGKVVFANKSCAKLAGAENPSDLVGMPSLRFLPPDSMEFVLQRMQAMSEGKEVPYGQEKFVRLDGSTIDVITSATSFTYQGKHAVQVVVSDVTDLKRAEKENKMLAQAVKSISECVSITDSSNTIIFINSAFLRTYGYEESDLIGKNISLVRSPNNQTKVTNKIHSRTLDSGWQGELLNVRKDGSEFPIFLSTSVVYGDERQPIGLIGVAKDISDRKRVEEQIKSSLREKEVLLKEIHHRVKNNMQIISSLLNLQSEQIKDHKVLSIFKESQDRVKSMALIHEKLYQSEDLARIDFAEYVRNLTSYLIRSYGKLARGITLDIDIRNILFSVNIAVPCGLIVNELVSNALKYAFPNNRCGSIMISINCLDDAKGNGNSTVSYALIVRDDGIGLPYGMNFRKTESLGLQLVNTLVSQLDGTIEVDTQQGTTFKVAFTA